MIMGNEMILSCTAITTDGAVKIYLARLVFNRASLINSIITGNDSLTMILSRALPIVSIDFVP